MTGSTVSLTEAVQRRPQDDQMFRLGLRGLPFLDVEHLSKAAVMNKSFAPISCSILGRAHAFEATAVSEARQPTVRIPAK